MNCNEIILDYLLENEINIQVLSKNTGIEDSVLYDYTKGILPNVKNAVILANYMNCSVNYLMGLDDEPKQTSFKDSYDITLFSNRYDSLLKEHNVSHFKICKEKQLNYSSHYAWQRGSIPNMTSLIIIANYFDVSIDYLIGRSDNI